MTRMTERRMDWLLRVHGPALVRWPPEDRAEALALLRHSPGARSRLAEALASDGAVPPPDLPALWRMQRAVRGSIAARARLPVLVQSIRWGSLAGCFAAGMWLGTAPQEPRPDLLAALQIAPLGVAVP